MLKGFVRFFKDLFEERKVIFDLAKNDFKSKYTNSLLGIAWAFLMPLTVILVLWFVFQVGFRSAPVDNIPFILWYIPAFLSWNFFTDALGAGSGCIFDYSYLVKNMQFRVSALPVVKIVSSSFVHFFFIIFIFFIYFIYGWYPSIYNIQVIYYYICTITLLLGMTWTMSALAVFSKDVLNIISLIVQVGFWATPLIWDPSTMPPGVQMVVKLNPMYYICMGYRETFSSHKWFWEHPLLTGYFWMFAIIWLMVGAYVFHKLRPQFADML
ncbi:MAG: ABC transporter permease [Lachnospiraceae bacterium]|nr:ABC transporter permease [Lachnospiraceae bacterium]